MSNKTHQPCPTACGLLLLITLDLSLGKLPRKSKAERNQERHLRDLYYKAVRPEGENLGWQRRYSGGIPVWQLVRGGKYREFIPDAPIEPTEVYLRDEKLVTCKCADCRENRKSA